MQSTGTNVGCGMARSRYAGGQPAARFVGFPMCNSDPVSRFSLYRQWKLLLVLAGDDNGRGVDELSRDNNVTDKTIRRDLALLRSAGFPIEETVGPRGRKLWKVAGAGLHPLSLNWQEALSL